MVYLSLGSNIGDRESNLAQATMALSINFEISDIISSSYYETEPLYNENQPDFLNSVVRFSTTLKPFDVLDIVQKVERMLGRPEKREKNQPRLIDIDILDFKGKIMSEGLILPHPRMHYRNFVLYPMKKIAPNWQHPVFQKKIDFLITKIKSHQILIKK